MSRTGRRLHVVRQAVRLQQWQQDEQRAVFEAARAETEARRGAVQQQESQLHALHAAARHICEAGRSLQPALLAAALLVNSRMLKWRPVWRVALFAPFVTTLVATAVVWNYLLHTRYGLINYGLGKLGIDPVDWLGNPRTSLPAILLFVTWKTFGYNMVIFLAALQSVSGDLLDAARVDGASWWTRLRHVILPTIAPTVLLVSILTVAGMFQLFAEPYVMTQGGPEQSTVTVLYFMYEEGFKWWNLGSGAAVAFILFLCILVVTLLQLRVARRSGAL